MRSKFIKTCLYLMCFVITGAVTAFWLGAPENSQYRIEAEHAEANVVRLMMKINLAKLPESFIPTSSVCENIKGVDSVSLGKRDLTLFFHLPVETVPEKFQAKFDQQSEFLRKACMAELQMFLYSSYVQQSKFIESMDVGADLFLESAKATSRTMVAQHYYAAVLSLNRVIVSTKRVPSLVKPLTENTWFRVIAGALVGLLFGVVLLLRSSMLLPSYFTPDK